MFWLPQSPNLLHPFLLEEAVPRKALGRSVPQLRDEEQDDDNDNEDGDDQRSHLTTSASGGEG